MEEKFEKWEEYMAESMDAFDEDNYDESIKLVNMAKEAGCTDNFMYAHRGECNVKLNNFKDAIDDLTIYLENEKNDDATYFYRGFIYMKIDNYEAALADFETGFKTVPREAEHYYYRGICLYNLHKYKSAIEDFDNAEKLGEKDKSLYRYRGAANYFLDRMVKAKKDFLIYLKDNDEDSAVYMMLSSVEKKKKNYEEALKHINHAIFINGENKLYYEYRMELYELTNQPEKAEADSLRIKELTPKHIFTWRDGELKAILEQLKEDGIIDEYRLPDQE
jgi:tetratricopeptide (TPR) repeat protein